MNKNTLSTNNKDTRSQEELLQSQTNVEENNKSNSHSNTKLIERESIDKTPFHLISMNQGQTWFIALGKYRMCEEQEDKEELRNRVANKDWGLILDSIAILTMKGE